MTIIQNPNYALDCIEQKTRLVEVIRERGVELVIETGLNEGRSTVDFCKIMQGLFPGRGGPLVIGIDHDPRCVAMARARLVAEGTTCFDLRCGHSPIELANLVRFNLPTTMFFLDAHWDGPSPLCDEIAAIPHGRGIIIFHDYKIPGVPFNHWDGVELRDGRVVDLDYDLVREPLTQWSATHRVEHLLPVSGPSMRGMAIAYPE